MADGPGASPANCVARRVDESLEGKSTARGDPPHGCVATAWEGETEASRRGEAEKSTGARELARLAPVMPPRRIFRDAIAAGER